MLSKLPACTHDSIYARYKHEQILILCYALSRFNLRERIQDSVAVICELLLMITLWVFSKKKFQKSFQLTYLPLFIHNISSNKDRETTDRKIFETLKEGYSLFLN